MTESFEDAIKALRHIARGNGSVLRIADRIVAAHERETKVEGVCGPITGELRKRIEQAEQIVALGCETQDTQVRMNRAWLMERLDAIDSVHAQLERENDELRVRFVNANRHALHMERENESLKAERKEPYRSKKHGSITGELRKWANTFSDFIWVNPKESEIVCTTTDVPPSIDHIRVSDFITAIVDRIDADYESACWEYEDEFNGWKFIHDTEFVELPKDADGVPIRVGDTVEYVDDTLAPRNVTNINLAGDGWWVYTNGFGRRPDKCRHVTPDTWERIIEDALDGYHDTDFEKLVARCKKLAGDAE